MQASPILSKADEGMNEWLFYILANRILAYVHGIKESHKTTHWRQAEFIKEQYNNAIRSMGKGKRDHCGGPHSWGMRVDNRQSDHCWRKHSHRVWMDNGQRGHYVGLTNTRGKCAQHPKGLPCQPARFCSLCTLTQSCWDWWLPSRAFSRPRTEKVRRKTVKWLASPI